MGWGWGLQGEKKITVLSPVPGTSYDQELQRCRMCMAGQYQSESGAASCILIEPGFFSAFAGEKSVGGRSDRLLFLTFFFCLHFLAFLLFEEVLAFLVFFLLFQGC